MPIRRLIRKPPVGARVNWYHPLAPFLRGFWLLNEAAGTTVENLARLGVNQGTLTNSPTWAQTAAGDGLSFAGTNQNVNCGRGAALDDLSDQTYEALIYYGGGTGASQRIIAKMNASFYNGLMLTSAGAIEYERGRSTLDNYYLTTMTLTANNLYHIIGTHDGVSGASQVYVDGVAVPSSSYDVGSGTLTSDAAVDLFLGNRSDNARPFKGTIIFARVYNVFCTPDMAAELYLNPYGLIATKPVRYFVGSSVVDVAASDAATLGESASVAASAGVTDSATGSETSSVAASASTSDTATASESASIAAAAAVSDSGALGETSALAAGSSVSDAGTLGESSAISAGVSASDAGTMAEASAIAANASASDAGTLAETSALVASSTVTDAGALGESASLVVAVSASDAATLSESSSVSTGSNPTSSDAGTLGESASISAALATSDAGALGEASAVNAALGRADGAALAESAGVTASAATSDAAALSESSALAISAQVNDAVALAEAADLFAQLAGVDSGALTETAVVTVIGVVTVTASDAIGFTESATVEIIAATHPAPALGTIGGRGGANVGGRAGANTGARSGVRNIARRRS